MYDALEELTAPPGRVTGDPILTPPTASTGSYLTGITRERLGPSPVHSTH